MTTFRVCKDKDNPYVMVNKAMIHDDSISWKAKGILLYFLSRPDDWVVIEHEAIKHASDGRDSFRSGVRELLLTGYVRRSQPRKGGKFVTLEYDVYERPMSIDLTDNGFSGDGFSPTTNNEETKERKNKSLRALPAKGKAERAKRRIAQIDKSADIGDMKATREIARLRKVAGLKPGG